MLRGALADDSRLKVVFLNPGGGPDPSRDGFVFTEGGLVHAVYSFAPLTDRYDVAVICPNVPRRSEGREYDFRGVHIMCPTGMPLPPGLRPGELSVTGRRLATVLHGPTAMVNYVLTVRGSRSKVPTVMLANGVLGAYLLSITQRRAPVIALIPHLSHDPRTTGSEASAATLTARFEQMLVRRLRVDGVAVVNPTVKDRLIECGMDPERIVCVGNGVDANRYAFAATKPGVQLTFAGRLRKLKCVDRVIDAFAIVHRRHPEAVLNVVGDGPMRRSLERQAASLGLGRSVVFHGFLSEDAKVRVLQASSVYLSASQFEGFGIPPLEAMATGAVPVISNIPAHAFLFQNRSVGFLAGSPEEMGEHALQLLEDAALRERMALDGRELVRSTWTWDAVAERYQALIERVLASHR